MCGRYVSPDEASIESEFNLVHFGFAGLWDMSIGSDGIAVESRAIVTLSIACPPFLPGKIATPGSGVRMKSPLRL
jgi:hypothetical protein